MGGTAGVGGTPPSGGTGGAGNTGGTPVGGNAGVSTGRLTVELGAAREGMSGAKDATADVSRAVADYDAVIDKLSGTQKQVSDEAEKLAAAAERERGALESLGVLTQTQLNGALDELGTLIKRAAAEGVHVGFREYFRVGLPVTVATLAFGSAWLWISTS